MFPNPDTRNFNSLKKTLRETVLLSKRILAKAKRLLRKLLKRWKENSKAKNLQNLPWILPITLVVGQMMRRRRLLWRTLTLRLKKRASMLSLERLAVESQVSSCLYLRKFPSILVQYR